MERLFEQEITICNNSAGDELHTRFYDDDFKWTTENCNMIFIFMSTLHNVCMEYYIYYINLKKNCTRCTLKKEKKLKIIVRVGVCFDSLLHWF